MKRVAIIGGGLAGLSCAFALRRRDVEVVVFEKAPLAGGRSPASFYLLDPDLFRDTFALIRQLGLQDDLLSIPPHAGQVYKGRVYYHRVASATGLLAFKGLNLMDKALLPRMAYQLARHAAKIDFHRPELGLEFDGETVASFVKRELSQNVLNYVAGPLISTLFFYGSDETSAWLYFVLAKHMHNVQMRTLRGGVERLAHALAKEVSMIVGARVERIEQTASGYGVNGESFSDVVVAVPGSEVLSIDGLEQLLSDDDRQFFQTCRYERVVSVQVATDRPVDGNCYAVSIPRVEKRAAATISFHDYIDPFSVRPGEGLLTISGGGKSVTPEQLLDDLRALYPLEPRQVRTTEWHSGMPMFPPGRFREITAFRARSRRAGLFFCGDYLAGPLIEGAIRSGAAAAAAIQT